MPSLKKTKRRRPVALDAKQCGKRFFPWVHSNVKSDEPVAFTETFNWRIFRILAEFVDGFEFLSKLKNEVSIFGSTRAVLSDPYYKQAKELGGLLAKNGYTVITGGGPGIMEAANWGAHEAGGASIGIDIELSHEQRKNQFVTKSIGFHHFFVRKVMLSASSQAYIFFPGGFGTLDEMTEMITLIQTQKVPRSVPVILVGKTFWKPFVDWMQNVVFDEHRYVSRDDIAIMHVVDSSQEIMKILKKTVERPFE